VASCHSVDDDLGGRCRHHRPNQLHAAVARRLKPYMHGRATENARESRIHVALLERKAATGLYKAKCRGVQFLVENCSPARCGWLRLYRLTHNAPRVPVSRALFFLKGKARPHSKSAKSGFEHFGIFRASAHYYVRFLLSLLLSSPLSAA